jgi:hypothetical protein
MKIKLSSTLIGTAVLAIAVGAGDTGRAPVDAAGPGEAACMALATAQFATVTALSTAYEASSTTQPAHCVVRGSAVPRTGADGKLYETRFELRLPTTAPVDANGARVLSRAFSDADLALIARSITATCDASDGATDAMVLRPDACRFDPKSCSAAVQRTRTA